MPVHGLVAGQAERDEVLQLVRPLAPDVVHPRLGDAPHPVHLEPSRILALSILSLMSKGSSPPDLPELAPIRSV